MIGVPPPGDRPPLLVLRPGKAAPAISTGASAGYRLGGSEGEEARPPVTLRGVRTAFVGKGAVSAPAGRVVGIVTPFRPAFVVATTTLTRRQGYSTADPWCRSLVDLRGTP